MVGPHLPLFVAMIHPPSFHVRWIGSARLAAVCGPRFESFVQADLALLILRAQLQLRFALVYSFSVLVPVYLTPSKTTSYRV